MKKDNYILLVIFFTALLVRSIYAIFFFGLENVPYADSYHYNAYAMNLIKSRTYVDDNGNYSFRAPGYPFFLAIVYTIFGHSYEVVKIIQIIISAAICVIIYFIALEVATENIACISGFLSCVFFAMLPYLWPYPWPYLWPALW